VESEMAALESLEFEYARSGANHQPCGSLMDWAPLGAPCTQESALSSDCISVWGGVASPQTLANVSLRQLLVDGDSTDTVSAAMREVVLSPDKSKGFSIDLDQMDQMVPAMHSPASVVGLRLDEEEMSSKFAATQSSPKFTQWEPKQPQKLTLPSSLVEASQ